MLNGWWDFARRGKWTGYLGGGIGAARLEISTDDTVVSGSDSENNFAFQPGVGATYDMGNDSAMEIGYRYVDLGETTVKLDAGASGKFKADITSNDLYVAWRTSF